MKHFALPQERSSAPLELHGVTKKYGDFCALEEVELNIKPGEIFALLGPNGAGKSTLINCVAGLARQSQGQISVFGYDTRRHFREARRLIGLVPQEIVFDPFFTPHESLMIQMGMMGVAKDSNRADELLELFALSDKRDAYTRSLSGGMKRRLLVAKALVHKPRLLFLDEPTAGVDVELRKDLWKVVASLKEEGVTTILTTHYIEEAEALADRVGVIHRGRILLVEERKSLMQRFQKRRAVIQLKEESQSLPEGLPSDSSLVNSTTIHASWNSPAELETILNATSSLAADIQFEESHLEDIFVELIQQAEEASRA